MSNKAYIQSVALTERPGARIGRVASSELTGAEATVSTVLDFLAVRGTSHLFPGDALIRLFRQRSPDWWKRVLTALRKIDAATTYEALSRAWRISGISRMHDPVGRGERLEAMSSLRREEFDRLSREGLDDDLHEELMAFVAENASRIAYARDLLDMPVWGEDVSVQANDRSYGDILDASLSDHVVGFLDYDFEGSVCWRCDGTEEAGVLVACVFGAFGDWWRPLTSRLEPLAWRVLPTGSDSFELLVVYRVMSKALSDELWSHTSHNDGIAMLCAPASASPEELFDLLRGYWWWSWARDTTLEFARRHGWLYGQRWGGGADEHFAIFVARDTELAGRIRSLAEAMQSDPGR